MKENAKAQHLSDQQMIDYAFELAEPASMESAKKHLKKCEGCQRRVAKLRATLDQIDLAREKVTASDDLIIKTVRKVTAPPGSAVPAETPARNVIAWPRIAWIGFAAAAAVAVAVVLPKLKQQMSPSSTVAMTAPAPAKQNFAHKDADAVVKKEMSLASEVRALRDAKAGAAAAPAKVAPPVNEPIPVELAKLEEAPRDAERREMRQTADKSRMIAAAPKPAPPATSASQFRAGGAAVALGGSVAAATPAPVAAPPAVAARARSGIVAKPAAEKPAEKPVMLAAANDEVKLATKMPAMPAAVAEQKPATLTLEAAKPVVVASAPAGAVADGIAFDIVSESLRSSELVKITLPSVSGMWQAGPQGMIRVRASCDNNEVKLRLANQGVAQSANIQIHPSRGTNILLSLSLEAGATTNVTVKIPARAADGR